MGWEVWQPGRADWELQTGLLGGAEVGCPGMEAGILAQDLPPAMLSARLPTRSANSQPADLSPKGDGGRNLSGIHPQTQLRGSPGPPILLISPPSQAP